MISYFHKSFTYIRILKKKLLLGNILNWSEILITWVSYFWLYAYIWNCDKADICTTWYKKELWALNKPQNSNILLGCLKNFVDTVDLELIIIIDLFTSARTKITKLQDIFSGLQNTPNLFEKTSLFETWYE